MKQSPDLSPRKAAQRRARDERLAQALRDNLKRRKKQVRAQAAGTQDAGNPTATLSDGARSSKSNDHGGTTAD